MGEKENKGFGSFFRSLFEKKPVITDEERIRQEALARTAKLEEEVRQEEARRKAAEEEQQMARENAARLVVGEGALLELWRRWTRRNNPLTMSLLSDEGGCEVVLNDRELTAERLRLTMRVERDARDFLREMNRYEEKRLRLEAARAMRPVNADGEAETPEETLEDVKTCCRVYVSANGMAAWVLLIPPSNPDDLITRTELDIAIKDGHIVNGISEEAVQYVATKHPYFTLVPIACGTPVQNGTDGRVEELYPRQLTKAVKVDVEGVADYRAQNYVQCVEEGDVICNIIPPKLGTPGIRLDGTVMEPKAVKAATIPAGKYTKITEDGLKLVADRTGHLEFDGKKFFIKVLLDIAGDVDYSTGNLDYNGDIHIHGDVRATFSVKATGNIIVDGLVEAAKIEAGGDVLISNGVLGDGNAEIICGGDLRAKFVESCTAYVGKSVFADCLMASKVYCDETIQILSGRGAIIGGVAVAGTLIKCKVVGTDSGRKTELELGAQTYIKMKHQEEIDELKSVMNDLTKLDRDIAFLEKKKKMEEKQSRTGADPITVQRLDTAMRRRTTLCDTIDELSEIQKLLEDKKPDPAKCRLESSTVYPPTMLTIGGAIWKFEDIKNRCAAWLDTVVGEINVT